MGIFVVLHNLDLGQRYMVVTFGNLTDRTGYFQVANFFLMVLQK